MTMTWMETMIITSMLIPMEMVTWTMVEIGTNVNGNCNIHKNGKNDVNNDNDINEKSGSDIFVNLYQNGNMNHDINSNKL